MKKNAVLLLFLWISAGFTYTQRNITGTWEGKLNVGNTRLRIVFHFEQQSLGIYSGTMDSPDQGSSGIHCDSLFLKKDSVIIQVKSIAGGYNGLIVDDSDINGIWEQGGMKIHLNLMRTKIEAEPKIKPALQQKEIDSNYVETEITLDTKTGKLYGTLCTPVGFVKGPVALIIAGSGPTDRDCNSPMMKTDAYKLLAHQLAGKKIATVRYDKRDIGESKGASKKEATLTFEDLVNDADGWLQMLKSDKRFSNVIVIGHSEGSLLGILIAKNGAYKYISIAGIGETADKVLKTQLSAQPKSIQDTAFPIIDSLAAGKLVKNVSPRFNALFRLSVQPYLISWFKYDPSVEIKKLTIPVLILQGTNDVQVTVDDAKRLAEADPKAKLILLESMNHVFRIIKGDRAENLSSYGNASLPIDPELVTDISDFINKN